MPRKKQTQSSSESAPKPVAPPKPKIDEKAIKKEMVESKAAGNNFKRYLASAKPKDLSVKELKELWDNRDK